MILYPLSRSSSIFIANCWRRTSYLSELEFTEIFFTFLYLIPNLFLRIFLTYLSVMLLPFCVFSAVLIWDALMIYWPSFNILLTSYSICTPSWFFSFCLVLSSLKNSLFCFVFLIRDPTNGALIRYLSAMSLWKSWPMRASWTMPILSFSESSCILLFLYLPVG